jgi:hypothetical protein
MGRIKINLDQLEEVRKQNEIAMNATEEVIGKAREDLASMSEEVWEGEDGDMARELLGDLVYKEMPETWKHIDGCHEAIKKAQKSAYEAKNYCNDFPKIFSGGEPNENNQFSCGGDLLCDSGSCAELKQNMADAGQHAANLKRHIEEAESILAQLETPEAKFDYSSYTEPIKKQAQDVTDYTGNFNVALTKYEAKVKELDDTLAKELIAAVPETVLKAFDPSCLLGGDTIHMQGGDIINTLESHNSIDIGGKLSDAQLENILAMLFDKKDIDVSGLSEENLGMAFITLPEEKKKAVLLEMGYTRAQIDSILESCKAQKASAIGSAFGRTLIDRIAGKNGDRYHSGSDKTGFEKALGLAGLGRPEIDGHRKRIIAENMEHKNLDGTGGSASANAQSKQSQKKEESKEENKEHQNTQNNKPHNKQKNGNSSSSERSEFYTGDSCVDNEIDRLLDEYNEDLSTLTSAGIDWYMLEDVVGNEYTKDALAAIYEKCIEKIGASSNDSECAKYRTLAENILQTTLDNRDYSSYVFDSEEISDLQSHLDKDSQGFKFLNELKQAHRRNDDKTAGDAYVDISVHEIGITVGLKDKTNQNVDNIFLYTIEEKICDYIEKCRNNDPDCYAYTRTIMSEEQLVGMYDCAETLDDFAVIDRLMKSNSKYENVFIGNPDNISADGAYALGMYGNNLLMLAKDRGGAFETCYNNFLSQLVTYHDVEDPSKTEWMEYNNYIERYNTGCSMVTDTCLFVAWATKESEYDEELIKLIENAKDNERISFALNCYGLRDTHPVGAEIKVNYFRPDKDATQDGDAKLQYNGPRVDSLSVTELYYPTLISLNPEKAKEATIVQLNSCYASQAKDIEDWKEREGLKEKQKEALWDIAIDCAIGVLGSFWKSVGVGAAIVDCILRSDSSNLSTQISYLTDNSLSGKAISASTSLYNALLAYQNYCNDFNMTEEKYKEKGYSSSFYTCNYCDISDIGVNYYYKMDDLGMIRALQNWSRDGLNTVYNSDAMKVITKNKEEIKTNIDNSLSDYDQAVIDKAWNTILDGYNDSNADTYMSILDIPEDIFRTCIEQINESLKDTNYSNVQATIETQRSDYIDPNDSVANNSGSDESDG